MTFTSLAFLGFLAVVWLLYFRAGLRRQNALLLVASYVFYGWWDWRFLGLLAFTSLVDYACGRMLESRTEPAPRKRVLALSVVTNLSVLGFFKYFDFFTESFAALLAAFGLDAHLPTLGILLPVGISFYTFQSMSYTIDVYRGRLSPTRDLLDYLVFVAFFPQLVAGPIMRARELLPQVASRRSIHAPQVLDGIWLILLGYLKKLVIADRLAPMVDAGFGSGGEPFGSGSSWLVLYAFAFQIYGDFAGYTDIARGVGKVMGFDLARNFGAPYLVRSPSAFWRHWHITLSEWLRDYLYVPLGGNRHGRWRTLRNLLLTMLLGGLWHGAGFAYIAWGLYHGLLLVLYRLGDALTIPRLPRWATAISRAVGVVIFFHLTCFGWLLFRAGSVEGDVAQLEIIRSYLAVLFTPPGSAEGLARPVLLLGGLALLLQWKYPALERFHQWPVGRRITALAVVATLIATFGSFEGSSFIYFQF